MVGSMHSRVWLASSLAYLALALSPGLAFAQGIKEPDGFGPVPVDPKSQCDKANANPNLTPNPSGSIGCTGSANAGDFNCCSNTLDNMSLIGLFKYYEVNATTQQLLVDFQSDAKTEPATFNPLCSIQGNLVMKGGGCYVDFGWYCVDDTKNYDNQPVIHSLVTAEQIWAYAKATTPAFPQAWQNNDGAFLPKTSYSVAGTPLSNVATDPDFQKCASKKIGFAVKGRTDGPCKNTSAGCICTQNKFSEQRLNQVNSASGKPYVAAVIYASKNFPGRYYMSFEDLPTSSTQFNAPLAGKNWQADGDFNDFVYTVEGVVCQGGGQLCTVPGKVGLCATGVTSCVTAPGAVSTCDPVFTAQPETCNAIDDDCDGSIDNGDGLCPAGQFCIKGSCVGACATGEFQCPGGQVCVGAAPSYCIDASCASLNCAADQKCQNGQCVGGCTGVTCTAGQQCVAGKCVDLCDIRTKAGLPACPNNFVCQNGACVPNCTCLPCPDPSSQECQSSSSLPGYGRCVASGCSNVTCPAGQLCIPGGTCTDPCNPNPCGANQTCKAAANYDPTQANQYSCTNPDGSGSVGGSGSQGGNSSVCLGCNTVGGNGNNGVGGNGNALNSPASSSGSMGCGCRVAKSTTGGWAVAGLLGFALMAARRRRR